MGTKERREREKAERRRCIVRAAVALFRAQGYEKTTMPQIAVKAELAPGTLYLYFPSKEALYAELLVLGYAELRGRLEAEAPPSLTARRQAEALMDVLLGFAQECPEYFDVIFFLAQREGKAVRSVLGREEYARRLDEQESACKGMAVAMLRRAGWEPGRGTDDTVDALWSMLVGVALYFAKDGGEVFGRVSAAAKQVLLRGLFGGGA